MRAFVLMLFLAVSACTTHYNFNGFSYDTPEAALQAQDKLIKERTLLVEPSKDPIGGRVLAVAFDRETIRGMIRTTGDPGEDAIKFAMDSTELNVLALKGGIERMGLFDEVGLLRAPTVPDTAEGYDYIVGQETPESTQSVIINTKTGERESFDLDPAADEIDRQISFAAALERAARKVAAR